MINISEQTLASIVTANHQVVPVLERYNLDFCCKGKRVLADACNEKGLELDKVVQELESVMIPGKGKSMPFSKMSAEQLIGHILVHHHFYVKESMPLIFMHLEKVVFKHGDKYPYMRQVLELFSEIQDEMTSHMQKEEIILFPQIKDVERWVMDEGKKGVPVNFIEVSVAAMETEHDHAGEAMFKIRDLTNNYTAPEGACTTFNVCLAELKEFEEDLHRHVHLENNILFPKAKQFLGGR